jgi:hypothetical protein
MSDFAFLCFGATVLTGLHVYLKRWRHLAVVAAINAGFAASLWHPCSACYHTQIAVVYHLAFIPLLCRPLKRGDHFYLQIFKGLTDEQKVTALICGIVFMNGHVNDTWILEILQKVDPDVTAIVRQKVTEATGEKEETETE